MSDDPIELLKRLVAINSVNPDLVPGGAGEKAIGDFCGAWLAERGFEVHRLEEHPGRPSIVGVAKGSGGGRSLMFNGHYDTVTLAGYDGDPLDPRIDADGKLYGRGSFDMKGGVAAMMVAAARAKAKNVRGDILVACVADEEYASFGTEEVARHFRADAAIVTEPSHLELTVAHKGFAWFEVIVEGRAAHGSRPDLGIDAIAKAGKFLVALEGYDKRMRANPTHAILKSGSVHASMIDGGAEWSSYPARCRISLERRTIPGETPRSVQARTGGDHRRRSPRRIADFQRDRRAGLEPRPVRGSGDRADRRDARPGRRQGARPTADAARRAVLDRLRDPQGSRHSLRDVRRRRRRRPRGDGVDDGGVGQDAGGYSDGYGDRVLR